MYSNIIVFLTLCSFIHAQLNPADAPWTTWSANELSEYELIVSTCTLDAYCTDTKQWDLLPHIFTQDAVASYGTGLNLTRGLEAIREVHVRGTAGFITQHLLGNFRVSIGDDACTANASYYSIATLFTNPQQNSGQVLNLYGYYNNRLVRTTDGWRIKHHQFRFFGPGWAGNLTILPPGHESAPPKSYEPPGYPSAVSSRSFVPTPTAG